MERPIEGPDPYAPRVSSAIAARFIGEASGQLFDALMAIHCPTIRPIYVGKNKMWQWMDVAILGYILGRAATAPPGKRRSESEESA